MPLPFRHLSCWKILKKYPKLEQIINSVVKFNDCSENPTEPSTSDKKSGSEAKVKSNRPTRRKRQKAIELKSTIDKKTEGLQSDPERTARAMSANEDESRDALVYY